MSHLFMMSSSSFPGCLVPHQHGQHKSPMSQPLETYSLREEQACDSKPGFKISTITENLGQFDGKRVDLYILGSVDNCRFDGNTNRSPRIVKKEWSHECNDHRRIREDGDAGGGSTRGYEKILLNVLEVAARSGNWQHVEDGKPDDVKAPRRLHTNALKIGESHGCDQTKWRRIMRCCIFCCWAIVAKFEHLRLYIAICTLFMCT